MRPNYFLWTLWFNKTQKNDIAFSFEICRSLRRFFLRCQECWQFYLSVLKKLVFPCKSRPLLQKQLFTVICHEWVFLVWQWLYVSFCCLGTDIIIAKITSIWSYQALNFLLLSSYFISTYFIFLPVHILQKCSSLSDFFTWVAYDLHSSPKMGICFRKFSILERRGSVALTKEEH